MVMGMFEFGAEEIADDVYCMLKRDFGGNHIPDSATIRKYIRSGTNLPPDVIILCEGMVRDMYRSSR